MAGFVPLEGDSALIVQNGVYRLADLYQRNGELFAKHGSGFVRLDSRGGTSSSAVSFKELIYNGPLYSDSFERLYVEQPTNVRFKVLTPHVGGFAANSGE